MKTLSQKITSAVLKGRAVLDRRLPTKAESITPAQAKANLIKFSELLTRLSDSRDELDAAQKISDEAEAKPEDLTARFLETGTLPKPGSLADDADAGKLLTSVIKSALDRLAADASRSISTLQGVKLKKINGIESEIRAQIERPLWMSPASFTLSVADSPILNRLHNLAGVGAPCLPLVVIADEAPLLPGERYKPTSVGLGQYRTRPLSSWERIRVLPNNDAFDPRHIAGWIGRWIEHLESVDATTSEGLMIS